MYKCKHIYKNPFKPKRKKCTCGIFFAKSYLFSHRGRKIHRKHVRINNKIKTMKPISCTQIILYI